LTHIYLALGSNMGDRLANLEKARQALAPQVRIIMASAIYETTPWGYIEQEDFLNQVLEAETELLPLELLNWLKDIEKRLGRKKGFRNGPRMIDVDILFYGELILEMEQCCMSELLCWCRWRILLHSLCTLCWARPLQSCWLKRMLRESKNYDDIDCGVDLIASGSVLVDLVRQAR